MKLTRERLKKIIKEELEEMMSQSNSLLKQIKDSLRKTFPDLDFVSSSSFGGDDIQVSEADAYIATSNRDEADKVKKHIDENFGTSVQAELSNELAGGPSVVYLYLR